MIVHRLVVSDCRAYGERASYQRLEMLKPKLWMPYRMTPEICFPSGLMVPAPIPCPKSER